MPMTPADFAALKEDLLAALGAKETVFVHDLSGGSQADYRVNVRIYTELAWQPVREDTSRAPQSGGTRMVRHGLYHNRSA